MAANHDKTSAPLRPTVVGVFDSSEQADRAVDELRRVGFRDDQIGYAVRGAEGEVTTGATGAATGPGLATGAVIGGLVGAAAALLIPGIGPVVAGGVLASVLGGAAVGAAAGGILGALVGMGIPEEEASYYESEFQAGRILVTVKADGRAAEAREVMRRFGAYDIENRPGGTDRMAAMSTGTGDWKTWDEARPHFQSRWQERFGAKGGRWDEFEPHYRYGWEMSRRPEYHGKSWNDFESQWQKDWEANNTGHPWERAKEGVRDAWEWTTGTQVRR